MGGAAAFAFLAAVIFLMLVLFLGTWGILLAAALVIGVLTAGLLSARERLDRMEKKLDQLLAREASRDPNERRGGENHESNV